MKATTLAPSPDSSTPSARRALADWLRAHDYTRRAIDSIMTHVALENTVDDAPDLDPADADAAEAVYVAGFESIALDSPDWDEFDEHHTPDDAIRLYSRRIELRFFELPDWHSAPAVEPVAVAPVVIPDAPDFYVTQRPGYAEALAADGIELVPAEGFSPLPAICGGCDDVPPPYEPTPADWADYHAAMATADYLDGFNAVRPD